MTKFIWAWCGLLLSSPEIRRVSLPWLMKLPGRDSMTIEFLGGSLSKQIKRVRESLSLYSLFFTCSQLKIINILKWHILVWRVLNFYSHILGWHIVLPFGIISHPKSVVQSLLFIFWYRKISSYICVRSQVQRNKSPLILQTISF